jgi:uncharacterized protein YodC (DUF2158 family)
MMAEEHTYSVGDIVQLKSGSPSMTVRDVGNRSDGSGQGVSAVWFEVDAFKEHYFLASMLVPCT